MYEELVKQLRYCAANECTHEGETIVGCTAPYDLREGCTTCNDVLMMKAADAIEGLSGLVDYYGGETGIKDLQEFAGKYWDTLAKIPRWIPVTEHLPKCEQEVLICTEKKLVGKDAYIDSIVTPAIYEDGTMTENDSIWQWEDIDWAGWDEDEDCGIIPEGWWENRHFNPDGVYNNPVDRKVVAWMPLPEKYEPQKVEGAYKDV